MIDTFNLKKNSIVDRMDSLYLLKWKSTWVFMFPLSIIYWDKNLSDYVYKHTFDCGWTLLRSLMETKLKTGTTLIVDRYSYSGVAFSSAKGLGDEWCKVKILCRLF